MAIPAAQPTSGRGRPPRNGRRPGRLAGALLATVAGAAVLGVGLFRAATGVAGVPTGDGAGVPSSAAGSGLSVRGSPLNGSPSMVVPISSPGASSTPAPSARPQSPPPSTGPQAEPGGIALGVRLQATLDALRAKFGIPGVSATILFPDGSSWTGVSGLAVVGSRTPVTPETAFAFASVSKTFTSALILQLVGEGKLRLADPAAGLLPPLRLAIDRRITVGMLLNHTSGLPDYFLNPKIDGPLLAQPAAAWTVDQTLHYVGKSLSPPGKAWHYANTNYLLLGLIAERIAEVPLATAIRTRLLTPTGLDLTWYQAAEAPRTALAHGYRLAGTKPSVRPVDLDDRSGVAPFRSVVTAAAGAGSIAGTSGDLARWGRALYSGRVLGPDGTALLLGGFSKTTNYLPGVAYGYGVQALSIDGHPSLGHSGRLVGFRSAIRHFSLDGLTIAVLTNQSRADPGVIVEALLARALPVPQTCPLCAMAR